MTLDEMNRLEEVLKKANDLLVRIERVEEYIAEIGKADSVSISIPHDHKFNLGNSPSLINCVLNWHVALHNELQEEYNALSFNP